MKLVISSGKGGVGKSMLTSALAMLSARKHKVMAVDCDVDAPNLAIWLNEIGKFSFASAFALTSVGASAGKKASEDAWDKTLPVVTSAKPEIDYKKCDGCGLCVENCRFQALRMEKKKPRLNYFLCEGCGACEVICPKGAIKLKPVQNGKINIKKTKYGFPLISGQLFPGEIGSGKVVDEIKTEAEKLGADLMIIDSAPGTGCPVIAALRDANFAILITEPTLSGFSDLKRVLKVVNHFRIPWGIVINKWDINKRLSERIKKWSGKKFLGRISYDKEVFKAISNLTPIMETNLKAKKEIKEIFKNINQLFNI